MQRQPKAIRRVLVAVVTALTVSTSLAYEPERATNNMAQDFAHCSAYFSLLAEMKELSEKAKAQYKESSFQMLAVSAQLTNSQTASARVQLSIKEMSLKLDGKAENWSILLNENAALCKGVAENPEARMKYWLEKQG